MKKPPIVIGGLTVITIGIAVAVSVGTHTPVANPDPNHTHADFAVWIDGKQLDFSDARYMSSPPAAVSSSWFVPTASAHGDEDDGHTVPGREYLHLHDGNGHVIHRHKPGLSFRDFLQSIGFVFRPDLGTDHHCIAIPDGESFCNESDSSSEHSWQLFINGKPFSEEGGTQMYGGIINYVFADGDQLLLTYGASTDEVQRELQQLTDDACKYSKTCPWKGEPPTENCIADPNVPCIGS